MNWIAISNEAVTRVILPQDGGSGGKSDAMAQVVSVFCELPLDSIGFREGWI